MVWKALVPLAPLRTRMRPLYTDWRVAADRALEEEVAGRLRRDVVLQGAEVVHLVAVAEVDGQQVAASPPCPRAGESVRTRA